VTTKEIPNGVAFELSAHIIGLERQTGRAVLVERGGGGPWRIDGYTIESSALSGPPRRIRVRLELEEGDREVEMTPGQALVIPQSTWHQIFVDEPGQLINVTPGPGGQHRPLAED
jgi:hypothetical protein